MDCFDFMENMGREMRDALEKYSPHRGLHQVSGGQSQSGLGVSRLWSLTQRSGEKGFILICKINKMIVFRLK